MENPIKKQNTRAASMGSTFRQTKRFHQTKNLHPNFIDKIPEQRRKNLMKVVESMLNKVDEALIARVKKEKQRIFNKEIEEGKRLSYFEIKELNTMLKGDYVKFIKKEDQIASHYIEAQQERNEEIHDDAV